MNDDIAAALKLEELRLSQWLIEAGVQWDVDLKVLHSNLAARGLFNSGGRYVQEVEVLFTSVEKVVDKAINHRKALGKNVPSLLLAENLKDFGSQLNRLIEGGVSGHRSTTLQADNPSADMALMRIVEQKTLTLRAKVGRCP